MNKDEKAGENSGQVFLPTVCTGVSINMKLEYLLPE